MPGHGLHLQNLQQMQDSSLGRSANTVLLAVHDPNQAALWAQALAATGRWQVAECVRSFARARQALWRHRPDLLVTELRLADGSATELVRVLRTGLNPLPTQILVVARPGEAALLLDVLQEGADNLVAADLLTPQALAQHARDTLDGHAEIAPWVARWLLDNFGAAAYETRRSPIEDLVNPLALTDVERKLLWRLSAGVRLAEVAREEGVRPRELAGRVRAIYRKMQWQRRAGDLSLAN